MKKLIYILISLVIVLTIITASFGAGYWWAKHKGSDVPSIRADKKLDLVRNVIDIVKEKYVEKVDEDELIKGAAAGVVNSLDDPYSHFLDKEHFERVEQETRGSYSGVGIYIGMREEHPVVQSVIDETPAFEAGLMPGDVIISVDGTKTQGMRIDEIADMIKGEQGTTVTLSIARKDKKEPFDVTITRAKIKIPNIESKIVEDNIGYLRLRGFNITTSKDVQKTLEELKGKGAKAFIIDLRNNPGGLLEQSIELSSMFIEKGEIVSIKGRNKQEEVYNAYRVSRSGEKLNLYEEPVVVLVNEGSASASEIFAGALKDHERATLIGEKTFGKGSVQDVVKLPDNSGVLITVAKYYTPSGKSIHGKGIEPDITVKMGNNIAPGSEKDIQLEKAVEVLNEKLSSES